MKLRNYTIYIVVILFIACSPTYILQSHDNEVIGVQAPIDSSILATIIPYQNGIEDQMNEVLTYTKNDLKKGRPQSTIGNFVTDLCLNYADAQLCVMNNGGLRTVIDKGNITRGKIYELMPFENELVILELNKTDYLGLLNYITKKSGEPFSGVSITMDEKGNIINHSWPVDFDNGEKLKVITSDYLANGGDKMSFFKDKEQIKVGMKLRDAIIDYCIKTDTIDVKLDDRIKIISNE